MTTTTERIDQLLEQLGILTPDFDRARTLVGELLAESVGAQQAQPVAWAGFRVMDANADKQGNWPSNYIRHRVFSDGHDRPNYGQEWRPLYTEPLHPRAQLMRVAEAVRMQCRANVQAASLGYFNGASDQTAGEMRMKVSNACTLMDLDAIIAALPTISTPDPMAVAEAVLDEVASEVERWHSGPYMPEFDLAAIIAALPTISTPDPMGELPDAVIEATAEALGGAYDCLRVWNAWGVGTMGPDDFSLVADDGERVTDIARAAIRAWVGAPSPAVQQVAENGQGVAHDAHHVAAALPVLPTDAAKTELPAFKQWWEDHGQFVRCGGGQYESCFAWSAWQAAIVLGRTIPVAPDIRPFECWSDSDGDSWGEHPADADFVDGLKVGDEYELLAGWRCERVTYRVVKAPDDESDDYEVELVNPVAATLKGAEA